VVGWLQDFADQVRLKISCARTQLQIDDLKKVIWKSFFEQKLTEDEATNLEEKAERRRIQLRNLKNIAFTPSRNSNQNSGDKPQTREAFYVWREEWRRQNEKGLKSRKAVRVLSYIADRLNSDPSHPRYCEAWPSVSTIAKKLRMRRAFVIAAIREAETLGYLRVIRGPRNRGHRYCPMLLNSNGR
jgi:hypothetical protein